METLELDVIVGILGATGGALTFAGAVIAFLNGRLNAASTQEERARIFIYFFSAVEIFLWILVGFGQLFGFYGLSAFLALVTFVFRAISFCHFQTIPTRIDIVSLVSTAGFVVLAIVFYFISRLVDIQESVIDILSKLLYA